MIDPIIEILACLSRSLSYSMHTFTPSPVGRPAPWLVNLGPKNVLFATTALTCAAVSSIHDATPLFVEVETVLIKSTGKEPLRESTIKHDGELLWCPPRRRSMDYVSNLMSVLQQVLPASRV